MENSQLITIITEDDEVFQFQGIVSYTGNDTSTLTSYPTSEGTPRTDNIYNNPNKFTCSISIGGSENVVDEWGDSIDRVKNAGLILTKWKEDAIALTITTNQKDYYNMFLVGISPQNNTSNSYDYVAGLEFEELRIASFSTEIIEVTSQYSIAQDESSDSSGESSYWSEITNYAVQDTIGIATGAGIGALVGSIVPGVGTAIGAGVGAVAGGLIACASQVINNLGELFNW